MRKITCHYVAWSAEQEKEDTGKPLVKEETPVVEAPVAKKEAPVAKGGSLGGGATLATATGAQTVPFSTNGLGK